MNRGRWTPVLATMFLAILVWCLVYTEQLVSAFRAETATMTRIYAEVQGGLADPNEQAADRALFRLQDIVVGSGVPLILSGPADTILAAANLPFPAETSTAEGQERIREYARRLDERWLPVGNPAQALVPFGDPPALIRLRWIPLAAGSGTPHHVRDRASRDPFSAGGGRRPCMYLDGAISGPLARNPHLLPQGMV